MTYRVVMSVVYVPSPMFSISLLVIHLALGCELLIPMVVWPSFWWWRVILCCRVQNKNTLTYCIYTYIRCCYAVSCETRLNLNFGCLFVVLDLLDSVVWSLFNRISFLGHVLIWTIPLWGLAFVEIDFGRISTVFRWNWFPRTSAVKNICHVPCLVCLSLNTSIQRPVVYCFL